MYPACVPLPAMASKTGGKEQMFHFTTVRYPESRAARAMDRFWPVSARATDRPVALHLGLLRHFVSVVDLDAKVADCAFQFGVPEQ